MGGVRLFISLDVEFYVLYECGKGLFLDFFDDGMVYVLFVLVYVDGKVMKCWLLLLGSSLFGRLVVSVYLVDCFLVVFW